MSNLVPEKRVDKNGVLTTKHVRSGPKDAAPKSTLPAPALTVEVKKPLKVKKPTKAQLEGQNRSFQAGRYSPDSKLLNSLGINPVPKFFTFVVSDAEFYDVLSVASDSDALALMHAGVTSSDAVTGYLEGKGLRSLIQRRDCADEALDRRIPPDVFMREGNNLKDIDVEEKPFYMDSIETAGIAGLGGNYAWDVKKGTIRLADIKAIGVTRVKNASSWPLLGQVLRKLASGEVNYTADDVKDAVHYYSPIGAQIETALTLADHYGSGFLKRLKGENAHVFDLFPHLKDVTDDRERGADIFLYAASVFRYGQRYSTEDHSGNATDLVRFFDAGVSPEDAATGAITINQLEAMEDHGIKPSVSGGWL